VGINDNFLELGGDSILSIQVSARARAAGLRVGPSQVFEHPTIAELATVVRPLARPRASEPSVAGPVPLTPVQRWFFERELAAPHHYNQSRLLKSREPLALDRLERAAHAVVAHHDALRLRFERSDGEWRQRSVEMEGARLVVDGTGDDPGAVCARVQASLRLGDGPLVRLALLGTHRLFVAIHHLAIDEVSWEIVLDDLESAYRQLADGERVRLPPVSSSFRAWAESCGARASLPERRAELAHWLAPPAREPPPLPKGRVAPDGAGRHDGMVLTRLDPRDTHTLVTELRETHRASAPEVLLTALVGCFGARSGTPRLRLLLEGHGRDLDAPALDVSRTVGWLTALYPLVLDLNGVHGELAALRAVKEQLRRIPDHGLGYGLLRYASDEPTRAALARSPVPEVSFNYLGQSRPPSPTNRLFAHVEHVAGGDCDPANARAHRFEVDALVADGHLCIRWSYDPLVDDAADIELLAADSVARLQALAERARAESPAYTPSDFALAGLDQGALDAVMAQLGRREDPAR
jgi:non-ribosomal peptide synthase protein (TIGR01720 family)